MKKTTNLVLGVLLAIALVLGSFYSVRASTMAAANQVFYISPLGSDSNNCSLDAPCSTFDAVPAQPGDTINLLAGLYDGRMDISISGNQDAPITITGKGAILDGGPVSLTDSEWLIFENLTFMNATNSFDVQTSHYITWRNNVFDFITRGLYIRGYSSHLLIENNEFYQSCSFGKTWSEGKGSSCEGGAVYGSSYGGGTYYIRNNHVHDAFNGFLFTDDSNGKWMNANVYIYNNRFERIIDDPVEPEGDSFNFHVFNNTMIDTHRMVSITESGLGPVFVYNNIQITTGNPTGESSRLNSAFKVDQSNGFSNGAWIFNNTIIGDKAANFSAFDMLSRSVGTPLTVRNNIYVTALDAFNKTPSGGSYDYDMSLSPFGVIEPNGIVTDPHLNANGSLSNDSPAQGAATEVVIPGYFASSVVIPAGANLGGFQSIPAPAWVKPPDYPSQIPANIPGWLDAMNTTSTTVPTNTPTATLISASPSPTETALPPSPTPTNEVSSASATETPIPASPTATETSANDQDNAYYVSPNGNDSNPGTLSQPFRTVQKGVEAAGAGDTIYLRAGTYNEQVRITKSGNPGAPITLTSYSNETATIAGGSGNPIRDSGGQEYWVIDDLTLTTSGSSSVAIMVTSSNWGGSITSHWTIRNNIMRGGGVLIRGNYHLVENNNIDGQHLSKSSDDYRSGIRDTYAGSSNRGGYALTDITHHNAFKNNVITGFQRSGIWSMKYTHDNLFENNDISDIYGTGNAGQCLNLDGYGALEYRHVVRGNHITGCGSEAIQLENVFDSLVENNHIEGTAARGITLINYSSGNCDSADGYGDVDNDNDCKDEYSDTIIRGNVVQRAWGGAFVNYGADGVHYLNNSAFDGLPTWSFTNIKFENTDVIGNIVNGSLPSGLHTNQFNRTVSGSYTNAPNPSEAARDQMSMPNYRNSVTTNWKSDFLGNPRVMNGSMDVGAIEYQAGAPQRLASVPELSPTPTATGVLPTVTPTETAMVQDTPVEPTETATDEPTPMPTATTTLVPPIASVTPVSESPTATASPEPSFTPTVEVTSEPAIETLPPATPTATATVVIPTATDTPLPATPTETVLPPTPTATASPEPLAPAPTEEVTSESNTKTIYDDKDNAFVYSGKWENAKNKKAHNGSFKRTTKDGASVTLNFSGQSFSVLYRGGKAFGKMDVFVDGELVGTINQQEKTGFKLRWDYSGKLTPGKHELKLVFVADETSAKQTYGSIDAVIVR